MVAFETVGDNDFRSIFGSVREEYEEIQERREAERMLRLLDELEQRKLDSMRQHGMAEYDDRPRHSHRVEHLRISASGDIEDDDAAAFAPAALGPNAKKGLKREAGKVHTLDDLPRESEFEMLFGPEPAPPEPPIKVETGLRLHDGKPVHRAVFPGWSMGPGLDDMQVFWSGMSFESIVFLAMVLFLFAFLLFKVYGIVSRRRRQMRAREEHQKRIQMHINQQVQQQVQAHLQALGIPSAPARGGYDQAQAHPPAFFFQPQVHAQTQPQAQPQPQQWFAYIPHAPQAEVHPPSQA